MPDAIPASFETEQEAHDFALKYGGPPKGGLSILDEQQNRQFLRKACREAGVTPGAFDSRILGWLGVFEDSTCAVVAALILRAYEAGRHDARPS